MGNVILQLRSRALRLSIYLRRWRYEINGFAEIQYRRRWLDGHNHLFRLAQNDGAKAEETDDGDEENACAVLAFRSGHLEAYFFV